MHEIGIDRDLSSDIPDIKKNVVLSTIIQINKIPKIIVIVSPFRRITNVGLFRNIPEHKVLPTPKAIHDLDQSESIKCSVTPILTCLSNSNPRMDIFIYIYGIYLIFKVFSSVFFFQF